MVFRHQRELVMYGWKRIPPTPAVRPLKKITKPRCMYMYMYIYPCMCPLTFYPMSSNRLLMSTPSHYHASKTSDPFFCSTVVFQRHSRNNLCFPILVVGSAHPLHHNPRYTWTSRASPSSHDSNLCQFSVFRLHQDFCLPNSACPLSTASRVNAESRITTSVLSHHAH